MPNARLITQMKALKKPTQAVDSVDSTDESLTTEEIEAREREKAEILAALPKAGPGSPVYAKSAVDPVRDLAANEAGIPAWQGPASPERTTSFGHPEPGPSPWHQRWLALFACRDEAEELARLLRGLIEQHKGEPRKTVDPAGEATERLGQLKALMEAHVRRYGVVVAKITVWSGALRRHLTACGSNIHDLPLFHAVNEVVAAMSRAETKLRSLPAEPPLNIDDPASLQARVRWLEAVKSHMKGAEGLPQAFGGAILTLGRVLGQFVDELHRHRTQGCRGNTCCFQTSVPPKRWRGVQLRGGREKARPRRSLPATL
jgi:hypothetical protein